MKIVMESLLEGASRAQGTVIIIDVFRAFTTASIAFSRGVDKIVLVAEVDEALALRERGVGQVCVGEVGGMKPDGFDFGNSPSQLATADIDGKTLIQSTRAGTVGMNAARNATMLYGGSLVGAKATVQAILRDGPELVTIVAMGAEARVRADEDEQCALYLRNLLLGGEPDIDAVRSLVLAGSEAQKYGDPTRPHFPLSDRDTALQVNSVPFAIKVGREDNLLVARPVSVS